MAYINQPPDLRILFADLDSRLRKLETAVRFTAPNVDFNTSTPTNPREGDIFWDTYNNLMKYWNGSAWIVFEDQGVDPTVITYTPIWSSLGTPPTYGAGTMAGKYSLYGNWVFFDIQATLTNVTDFGSGQYTVTLPFTAHSFISQRNAGLHEGSNHYSVMLDSNASLAGVAKMYYNGSNGQDQPMTSNQPHNLVTTDLWYASGVYLRA